MFAGLIAMARRQKMFEPVADPLCVDAHEDSVARHQAFVDRIAPAARNIHAYWLARRAPRARLRQLNKAPDPGRNDPCPCGSGKKFKRCHGAPDVALH
jgi:uncharacterized protein